MSYSGFTSWNIKINHWPSTSAVRHQMAKILTIYKAKIKVSYGKNYKLGL